MEIIHDVTREEFSSGRNCFIYFYFILFSFYVDWCFAYIYVCVMVGCWIPSNYSYRLYVVSCYLGAGN